MTKLEMVLDNTLDVSDATIQERFNKFHDKFLKSKKDIDIDVNANMRSLLSFVETIDIG